MGTLASARQLSPSQICAHAIAREAELCEKGRLRSERACAQGADELVFLDITASSASRETTYDVVQRTAESVFIPLTVGGGVRTVEDFDRLLRAGADKVGVNTAAIADPSLITKASERFGSQCVVLSVDARRCAGDRPRPCDLQTGGGCVRGRWA